MEDKIELLKALSDKNRLLILDMLSCGELCGCDIMEGLSLTQPTISHHMKILQQCKLVMGRKEGKWTFYSINRERVDAIQQFIHHITSFKENCICERVTKTCSQWDDHSREG
ncbi:ArsR/SmtB family transcription factor [Natronincola ferrireducens]|uniref:Transcriptional regulator, ArsR family n=1 Tax=Natronincola ferrireducens TaxID=393762 RepID=A0A1G8ZFM3_9FIRM|nr:metalloregulator ArsR/SmtB family transcription factor [Natronincola ferrireducens]SDK13817.1 transcriptional regulator, ArsR family [Natronincola ferrireducens]